MMNNLEDCRTKAIYTYLVGVIGEKDIKELITLLKDYVYNGSFVDFEEEDSRVQKMADDLHKLLGF